jgi:hypothetical protein
MDYLEDHARDDMIPREELRLLCPEYQSVDPENFRSNWAAMKEHITAHKTRADEDETLFLHDMASFTLAEDLPGYWDGSTAQWLLWKDIERNRHLRMKPELLRLRRPEYQEFCLEFRKHIYQETRSHKETPYWTYKKKKKEISAAVAQNDDGEENLDFFDDLILHM